MAGQIWDLVVTLDDATSEVYSGFFVGEEGTMSTFRALHEVIAESGLFCSLYTDRASHYWHTPAAGGKVDKDNPTQVGRALAQLGKWRPGRPDPRLQMGQHNDRQHQERHQGHLSCRPA